MDKDVRKAHEEDDDGEEHVVQCELHVVHDCIGEETRVNTVIRRQQDVLSHFFIFFSPLLLVCPFDQT